MRFPLSATRLTLRSFPTKAEVDISRGVNLVCFRGGHGLGDRLLADLLIDLLKIGPDLF